MHFHFQLFFINLAYNILELNTSNSLHKLLALLYVNHHNDLTMLSSRTHESGTNTFVFAVLAMSRASYYPCIDH